MPSSTTAGPSWRVFPRYAVVRGTQEFVLRPGGNLVGRDPAARVYIDHSSVSRQHARIVVDSDGVTVEDLDSRSWWV